MKSIRIYKFRDEILALTISIFMKWLCLFIIFYMYFLKKNKFKTYYIIMDSKICVIETIQKGSIVRCFQDFFSGCVRNHLMRVILCYEPNFVDNIKT